jgi:hypothetical protein
MRRSLYVCLVFASVMVFVLVLQAQAGHWMSSEQCYMSTEHCSGQFPSPHAQDCAGLPAPEWCDPSANKSCLGCVGDIGYQTRICIQWNEFEKRHCCTFLESFVACGKMRKGKCLPDIVSECECDTSTGVDVADCQFQACEGTYEESLNKLCPDWNW